MKIAIVTGMGGGIGKVVKADAHTAENAPQ